MLKLTNGGHLLGQGLGTLVGLVTAFVITFIIMTFGIYMPENLVSSAIVSDFLSYTDLELRLAVVGTILYPSAFGFTSLGSIVGFGASGATVLMFLAWGTGGLVAGLLSKDFLPGILAGVFAAVMGSFLIWLLFFMISPGASITGIFDPASLLLMEAALEGSIYPAIAAAIGGILGGGITRDR
ncbi:MAG: hypothetical protein ACTSV3_04265 [Candidatus Thorarchaeota archaeon]